MFRVKHVVLLVVLLVLSISLFADTKTSKILLDVNPNPVKDETTISVFTDKTMEVNIVIIDEKGIVQKSIFSGILEAGNSRFDWDRTDYANSRLPEGKYIVELTADAKFTSVKKIIILK